MSIGEEREPSKDLLISIVNGNDRGYIYECVESIIRNTQGITYDIVVIDNCTGDARLSELEEMGATLMRNERPMGFSSNHSQVLPMLDGYRYLLVFNDDAYPANNAFGMMIRELDDEPTTAIAGCRIIGVDGEDQPGAAPFPGLRYFVTNALGIDRDKGARYPRIFTEYIDFSKSGYVDWVSGCSMMLRTAFIREHGFLDTGYFMFLEDTDICRRARAAGYRVKYMAQATVVHYGGGSSKVKGKGITPQLYIETQRSRLRYLKKYTLMSYFLYWGFINIYVYLKVLKSALSGDMEWVNGALSKTKKRLLT
ncbi:hypothetical protein TspCOW1_21110 [Thiohalobacter sp. COW1]|nr:hypothetical protein TspCOW1_21110 [Thiohalobacter sp. COW1]